ncbi:hypothetical protein [Xanthomonas campestris]|uniref:hypothetical protein n=1 Tax=Xanthomonas campestris TaxID=339 RepID=UPI00192D3C07|nr:hypothetical protein [Xanthomonas campestris]
MTEEKTNTCSATLDLVAPPIPNSLAIDLVGNEVAESILKQSDFYMIAGRAQATFGKFRHDSATGRLHFEIAVAGGKKDSGWIVIDQIHHIRDSSNDLDIQVRWGDSQIAFFEVKEDGSKQVFAAFTPDDVLMRRGRKEFVLGGFNYYLDLAMYDLLYVGIAKKGDTYERLFAKGHLARMEILAKEPQRYPGARVSDETYLFAFKVEPLMLKVFGPDSEINDDDLDFSYDNKRLVADAEKAMVSLLKPPYNKTLYPNYPKGTDGLYGRGLTAYTYAISEGMAFRTAYGTIKGGRERDFTMSNEADFMMVKGNEVTFHISGVDFAVE